MALAAATFAAVIGHCGKGGLAAALGSVALGAEAARGGGGSLPPTEPRFGEATVSLSFRLAAAAASAAVAAGEFRPPASGDPWVRSWLRTDGGAGLSGSAAAAALDLSRSPSTGSLVGNLPFWFFLPEPEAILVGRKA